VATALWLFVPSPSDDNVIHPGSMLLPACPDGILRHPEEIGHVGNL